VERPLPKPRAVKPIDLPKRLNTSALTLLGQSELIAETYDLPHVIDNGALSILSRTPIARSHGAALPEAPRDEPRQVLLAETLIDGRPLLVANTLRPEMMAERKVQVE
jgi:endonuclease/exonuclease/phosphatase family metal-dependent hydrolase